MPTTKNRPALAPEKYKKLCFFVLNKYGKLRGYLTQELDKAIDEYVDRHRGEKCEPKPLEVT